MLANNVKNKSDNMQVEGWDFFQVFHRSSYSIRKKKN